MTNKIIRAGIIGQPVAHSRSPNIHGYWLKTYGIAGSYDRYLVKPEELEEFLATMPDKGLSGCNVTMPHKEGALRCCRRVTDRARDLGAANTLWFEDGVLCGDNTDIMGFISSLDEVAPDWAQKVGKVAILGAGGAARAIIYGLAERGVQQIEILNRGIDRADALVASMTPILERFGTTVTVLPWDERNARMAGVDLLINTTSLGMKGEPALDIDLSQMPATAIVADIVYVPLVTPLLAQAGARGLITVDGLGMLLHQATPGFEKWFGRKPVVTAELRALVEADIPRQ